MDTLLTLVMAISFLIVGWGCFCKPRAIQRWLIALQQNNSVVAQINPLRNWIEKESFQLALRVAGALCLINAAMLFYLINESPDSNF